MSESTIITARVNGHTIEVDLDQVFRRFLTETLQHATAQFWHRRADEMSRIGTPWGDEAAAACRARARIEAGEFDDES